MFPLYEVSSIKMRTLIIPLTNVIIIYIVFIACTARFYIPAPLRVFRLVISSVDLDAPLVLLAGVANGEAVFCRTDLLVVTSPEDSLLDADSINGSSSDESTSTTMGPKNTKALVSRCSCLS